VLDRLDAGGGVVDRRRQDLAADIDQTAQPEGHVLDHGPLEADGHHGGQRRLERLGVSRRLVEVPAPVEG
jgi:hypothetical protein